MALISSKNLAAPLTNKIHITTIILVALLFAVFRLAGGGVDVKTSLKETFKKEQANIIEASRAGVRGVKPQAPAAAAQGNSPLQDLLESSKSPTAPSNNRIAVGTGAVPPWQRGRAEQPAVAPANTNPPAGAGTQDAPSEATSLDDIRRMLNSK